MEIKTHIHFLIDKQDFKYVFIMPAGGTLGNAYDACFEVMQKILDMSQEAADKSKRQEEKGEPEDGKK